MPGPKEKNGRKPEEEEEAEKAEESQETVSDADDDEAKARAEQDKEEGKAPSTQAGEFVREEIHHVREGKHGARSTKQAIAIGLSKARRSGVSLPAPKKGQTSERTRKQAKRDTAKGRSGARRKNPRRSKATLAALRREGRAAGRKLALARQARSAAKRRTRKDRSASAKRAAQTKGPQRRRSAARKAARNRRRRR
jgi:hypothetical protein